MNLEGTETLKNLARAFAGESQARNRYDFYANQLRREGNEYLYRVISEISHNEHAHAKIFWNYLVQSGQNGFPNIDFDAGYPYVAGDSIVNLTSAAHGEEQEATEIYPKFAEIARQENFPQIATSFEQIAKIEASHNQMFTKMRDKLQNGSLYKKANPILWKCENCGYEFSGSEVPPQCPVCQHATGFFNTPIGK